MHETIAYLMQLAEANLFPSFPFLFCFPVFFFFFIFPPSPNLFLPILLLVSFVSPYPRGAEGKLDSNQCAFAIFADGTPQLPLPQMQIKSRQFTFFHR